MKLLISLLFSLVMISACRSAGEDQAVTIETAYPADNVTLNLNTTAGTIAVGRGDFAGVSGSAVTNVTDWRADVSTSGNTITIAQGRANVSVIPNAQNQWNLALGAGVPLTINQTNEDANTTLNLGGLALNALNLTARQGNYTLAFDAPMTSSSSTAIITTQNGDVAITGLLNARLSSAAITTFAGAVQLTLDGEVPTAPLDISIETRIGNIQLTIPHNILARINYRSTSGAVLQIDPQFTRVDALTITNGDLDSDAPVVTIDITTRAGDLRLTGAR